MFLVKALVFLVMICVIVGFHELGHYLFAKLFKMKVEEFSIGMGPKLFSFGPKRKSEEDTEYNFRAVPLGGFVKIAGMTPEEGGAETTVPGGFYASKPWQRLCVLGAGPAFSLLLGVILTTLIFWVGGEPKPSNEPVIGGIAKGGPADKSGIRTMDRILQVNGQAVSTFFEVVKLVRDDQGKPITLTIDRAGKQLEITATPEKDKTPTPVLSSSFEPTGEKRIQYKLNVGPRVETVPVGFLVAVQRGLEAPIAELVGITQMFKSKSVADNVGGPIAIAQVTGMAVDAGLKIVLSLVAGLTISIGYLNLLPVPPFDGGQMMVALVEMFRGGRRISFRIQGIVNAVGLVLVGCMVISIFYLDISRTLHNMLPTVSHTSK